MPQTLASTSAARGPVSRTRARPWVTSVAVTSSPGQRAARSLMRAARAGPWPGAASSSHSPGPDPATSVPPESLTARPNGTASSAAARPPIGARTPTLASGVQSVRVSPACARRPLTSQPSTTSTGGGGSIGLRAPAQAGQGG